MCAACAIMRPAASNSADEASRRSRMFGDSAPRSSTVPISSAIMETAWDITLSERGSNILVTRDS